MFKTALLALGISLFTVPAFANYEWCPTVFPLSTLNQLRQYGFQNTSNFVSSLDGQRKSVWYSSNLDTTLVVENVYSNASSISLSPIGVCLEDLGTNGQNSISLVFNLFKKN